MAYDSKYRRGVSGKIIKVGSEKFLKKAGQNILVVGRPKTGTTVVSKTIQNSLPNASYFLEPPKEKFFLSPLDTTDNKYNVVKILYGQYSRNTLKKIVNNEFPLKFDKIIFIIRDPRDEFISYLMYWPFSFIKNVPNLNMSKLKEWQNLIMQKEKDPKSISAIELNNKVQEIRGSNFLQNQVPAIKEYYQFLKQLPQNSFILKYEEFIMFNTKELEKYLGFRLIGKRDVGNLKRTHRTGSFNNWKSFFTQQDLNYFRDTLKGEMLQAGYTDVELVPQEQLNPQVYSKYLENLLKEALGARRHQ